MTNIVSTALKCVMALVAVAVVSLFVSTAAYSQTTFDHFSTGFILDGAHTNVSCEGCHVSELLARPNQPVRAAIPGAE